MAKTVHRSVREFRIYWKWYLLQSLAASLSIYLVFMVLQLENAVVVASLGATTFIIFAMPRLPTAFPRHVIGGHAIGLFCGWICSLIVPLVGGASLLIYSLAVGFSLFLMVSLDMEHPPASGTALGLGMAFSGQAVLAVLTSAFLLSLIHKLFSRRLRNIF